MVGGPAIRGFLSLLVLASLVEGGAHGYEVMKRVERITGGLWKPAPGSLYPLLNSLEHEGFIDCSTRLGDGRRVCRLTSEGLSYFIDAAMDRLRDVTTLSSSLFTILCAAAEKAGGGEHLNSIASIARYVTEAWRRALSSCSAVSVQLGAWRSRDK